MLSSVLIYHQHISFQRQPLSSVYNTHCPVSADYKWAVDNCRGGFSNSGQGEQRRGPVWCRHRAWFMSSLCPCVSVFLWGIKLVCPPAWQYEANLPEDYYGWRNGQAWWIQRKLALKQPHLLGSKPLLAISSKWILSVAELVQNYLHWTDILPPAFVKQQPNDGHFSVIAEVIF